jgi:hypothetical protein
MQAVFTVIPPRVVRQMANKKITTFGMRTHIAIYIILLIIFQDNADNDVQATAEKEDSKLDLGYQRAYFWLIRKTQISLYNRPAPPFLSPRTNCLQIDTENENEQEDVPQETIFIAQPEGGEIEMQQVSDKTALIELDSKNNQKNDPNNNANKEGNEQEGSNSESVIKVGLDHTIPAK